MEEVMASRLELQKQIRQEGRETRDMKTNATTRSVQITTGRGISNAKLLEHFKWEQHVVKSMEGFIYSVNTHFTGVWRRSRSRRCL